ncbi:hypothetical protein BDF21DRAFT_417095 [Thamnidium elegans]|nr:hypothetical protein BDF21DRAFT_417095 [Thamnidium elegans]
MPLTNKITPPSNSLDHMPKPEVVLLIHRCFYHKECTKHYATPQNLREHLKKIHSFTFPIRIQTIRRYNSESFCFLRGFSKHKNFKEHHACPCCVSHFKNLSDLNQHFQTVHKEYLPFQQQQNGSDSSESSSIDRLDQNQDSINTLEPQQEESFQEVSQKRSYNEIVIHDDISFDPPHGEHFLVNNFDASNAIHRMQLSLKEHMWKLSLEDNLYLALASMSALLLSPNRYPEEVKPFFRQALWRNLW